MNIGDYARYLWREAIYLVVSIIYLITLGRLNKELLTLNFESPFELLVYKNWAPIGYFVVALILVTIGGLIVTYRVRLVVKEALSICEFVAAIIAIMVIITIFVLILVFINNPIFRTILTAVAIIFGGAYIYTR